MIVTVAQLLEAADTVRTQPPDAHVELNEWPNGELVGGLHNEYGDLTAPTFSIPRHLARDGA